MASGDRQRPTSGHSRTALSLVHELPAIMEQAEVRLSYARMLIVRDDPCNCPVRREVPGAVEG